MKQCRNCQLWKDEDEFPYKSRLFGTRHSVCKTCTAKRSRDWYSTHSEQQKKSVKARRSDAVQIAREFVWNYLSHSVCADCGEYDPMILEFDHVRGRKKMSISQMVRDGYAIDAIRDEITKCEVVCGNCHTRREKKRRGTRYW